MVNLAGSRLTGNPHSKRWAEEMVRSRVITTRVLAEAIAASERKPAFLAGNGSSSYGDRGDTPLVESEPSTGEAFMTTVTRQWQAATSSASAAGARVCVLRSAPVIDQRNLPWKAMFPALPARHRGHGRQRRAVRAGGLGPRLDRRRHARGCRRDCQRSGEPELSRDAPTNREFVKGLGHLLSRPTVLRVPGVRLLRVAAGRMAPEMLGSTRPVPEVLLRSGYRFRDPDVGAVLREGLSPSR